MASASLYRRHRPRSFADVVGQEHVVQTLRNAVTQGKMHHAYLFVGSRGTGKTSMAKILASCLNCENGPTIEPCGTCTSCVAIASATSLDVIEMDAASNNSVDDIRELRESVAFAPVSGRYKVYILDEAHMLSSQAWNALLKTLEEPPPGTIFVLATTEAAKILPTVVDRCHRFDFQRPTVEQLAAVVDRVAGKESIEIGPDAVALLARHATGSFRDALGTLEQLVTYSGSTITVDDLLAVLGIADADLLFGTLDSIATHDAPAALRAAARLVSTGRDVTQFMRDLEAHARELMIVRVLGEVPDELAVTPDRDVRLATQAQAIPGGDVVRLIDLLAAALRSVKDGADARTHLELALVKAATPEVDGSTRALLARIERLEAAPPAAVRAPAPLAAPSAAPPAEPAAPAPAAPAPVAATPEAPAPPPPPPPAAPAPTASGHAQAEAVAVEPDPEPEPVIVPSATALDFALVTDLWPAILETVSAESGLLGAVLADAKPVSAEARELVIHFPAAGAFAAKQAQSPGNLAILTEAVRVLTGVEPRLRFELRDDDVAEEPRYITTDELVALAGTEFDAVIEVPPPAPAPEPEPEAAPTTPEEAQS